MNSGKEQRRASDRGEKFGVRPLSPDTRGELFAWLETDNVHALWIQPDYASEFIAHALFAIALFVLVSH